MILVSLAVAAPALLGFTLGEPPPADAVCVTWGQGLGACGPTLVPFAGIDVVTLQADTCAGRVTRMSATALAPDGAVASTQADKLRTALQAAGWVFPAEPTVRGAGKSWAATPVGGATALVDTSPFPGGARWTALAVVYTVDARCAG